MGAAPPSRGRRHGARERQAGAARVLNLCALNRKRRRGRTLEPPRAASNRPRHDAGVPAVAAASCGIGGAGPAGVVHGRAEEDAECCGLVVEEALVIAASFQLPVT